jgi:hypothetical protein
MNRHAAHYTLVRLLPQADAGEFANIGVVLGCPGRGFFGFRLIKRYMRVTRFFEEFAGELFPRVRREVQAELQHIKDRLDAVRPDTAPMMTTVMNELARPREAMVRYAPLRTLMTDDPEADIDRLFALYVQREGTELQQRREELLARAVRGVLTRSKLGAAFTLDEIGDDDFHVRFPFVHERDGRAVAAIKPLDLAQDEPQKIYDHGDLWTQRLARLRRMGLLPQGLLIPADRPPQNDLRRAKAFMDIERELTGLGALVTQAAAADEIVTFARRYAN